MGFYTSLSTSENAWSFLDPWEGICHFLRSSAWCWQRGVRCKGQVPRQGSPGCQVLRISEGSHQACLLPAEPPSPEGSLWFHHLPAPPSRGCSPSLQLLPKWASSQSRL